jgi:uncharacterized membrane protein YkoI
MKRRTLLALLFATTAWPAIADDDDDGDDGDDDDGGDDDSDDDEDGGDDAGGDNSDDGSEDEDQDEALKAVASRGVLELADLLVRFADQLSGRVVDVLLIEKRGAPVFRITYVDPAGRVRRAELDARTGTLLR